MKKFRLLFLIIAAMLAGTQAGVAQNWKGSTPTALKSAAGNDINTQSEDANFFLYNVGTGKFLTIGGLWGTQAVLKDVGLLLTLDDSKQTNNSNGDEVYSIHTKYSVSSSTTTADAKYIQLMDGSTSTSEHDEGLWYTDRSISTTNEKSQDLASFYFHRVKGEENKYIIYVRNPNSVTEDKYGITNNPYYNKRVYLVAPEEVKDNTGIGIGITEDEIKKDETTGNVTYDPNNEFISDPNAQWILVPLSEVRQNFQMEAVNATEQYPADGSYIIRAQNFSRNNGDLSQWRVGNISDNNRLNTTSYAKSYFPENNNYMLAPTANTFNYYVGNGYHVDDNGSSSNGYNRDIYYEDGYNSENDKNKEHLMSGSGDSHQKNYGGYWTANIKGPGTIWQQIYTPIKKAGWYIVSCDGFTTATQGNVYIFAATTTVNFDQTGSVENFTPDSYNYRSFNLKTTAPATYTQAGIQLLEGNNKKSVMLYIDPQADEYKTEDNQYKPVYLIMGVQATGETGTDGENNPVDAAAWTCIDNFEVKFAGSQAKVIVLDENQTRIDYINTQVEAISKADDNAGEEKQYYTLCLDRSITAGQWSSLILPVDLTAYQLKMGFGQGTKLSVKNEANQSSNSVIEFVSVPLNVDNNTVVLKAGTPYIIKPSNINYVGTDANEEGNITATSVDCIDGKTWAIGKHIEINQVRLENTLESADVATHPYDCKDGGSLTFNGTYTQQDYKIPEGSYLLSGGEWYYMTVPVNTVKGFRTWLQPNSANGSANMQFSIDGVIDGDTTNSIEGIENDLNSADNKVYNMNGQLVRNGSTSLEGLPKGIYIVNNKKYIVK